MKNRAERIRASLCAILWLFFLLQTVFAQKAASSLSNAEPESPGERDRAGISQSVTVPRLLKVSGILKDRLGNYLAGPIDLLFSLYNEQEANLPVWSERQQVEADEMGRYSVLLGASEREGLPLEIFSSGKARWLGVQVQLAGEVEQSRIGFVSVPYALKAGDAETLGGLPASAFLRTNDSRTESRSTTSTRSHVTNTLSIDRTSQDSTPRATVHTRIDAVSPPTRIMVVGGSGTPGRLAKFVSAMDIGDSALFESGGNVGIGTTTPTATLESINSAAGGTAVQGQNTAGTGTNYGVRGVSSSTGYGSAGVRGETTASTGQNYGVLGVTTSTTGSGAGVRGEATLGSAVWGVATSPNGNGVKGQSNASSGAGAGVWGASSSTGGTGVFGTAAAGSGSTFGVRGTSASTDGTGVKGEAYATSGYNVGVHGTTSSISTGAAGVRGEATSTSIFSGAWGVYGSAEVSSGIGVMGQSPGTAVKGVSTGGTAVWADGASRGVYAGATASNGRGIYAHASGTDGIAAQFYAGNPGAGDLAGEFTNYGQGNILIGKAGTPPATVFRLDGTGRGFFNGGVQTGGADFAESVETIEEKDACEPGDVLVIGLSKKRAAERSAEPYSTRVAGIYSTRPGILATPYDLDDSRLARNIPLAVIGIVPCKVSAENGAIEIGDLLVTSVIPGHAMKGTDRARMLGSIVGKALESLQEGTGVIEVLVTLQ